MVVELDAADGEGPGPELGFHGGGLLLRQMFFPQDLIAVRGGELRHTLDVHRHPLAARA